MSEQHEPRTGGTGPPHRHTHWHDHGAGDDHDHDHPDGFAGAHSHAHNHVEVSLGEFLQWLFTEPEGDLRAPTAASEAPPGTRKGHK